MAESVNHKTDSSTEECDSPVVSNESNTIAGITSELSKVTIEDLESFIKRRPDLIAYRNLLQKHPINAELRRKMVEWMVEAYETMQLTKPTIHIAVRIMDTYLLLQDIPIDPTYLQMVGIISLHVASKFVDVYGLTLDDIHTHLCEGLVSREYIVAVEREVLTVINFSLNVETPQMALHKLVERIGSKKIAITIAEILLLFATTDDLLSSLRPRTLAAGALVLAHRSLAVKPETSTLKFITDCGSTALGHIADKLFHNLSHYAEPASGKEKSALNNFLLGYNAELVCPLRPNGPIFRFNDPNTQRKLEKIVYPNN
jgi:hypothetical protein